MQLNWSGYQYRPWDGYGRYGAYMVSALLKAGVDVTPVFEEELNMPKWMQEMRGFAADDRLTISCLPPYFVLASPGRHWLLTMTEGSECPDGWADTINKSGVERVIVPCEHNADVFRRGGINAPIHVIPGGTDPDEFPLLESPHRGDNRGDIGGMNKPYTFLTLADRGSRKGWEEAYSAFFLAFGTRDDMTDVRLIVKCRPDGNDLIDLIRTANNLDPRIIWQVEDATDIAAVYALADCLVLPSRTEGWGMPHRECAAMGLPVITQAHAGLDDGHTHMWAIVVERGRMEPITDIGKHIAGKWRVADVEELAARMRQCYESPEWAATRGRFASEWLRMNQTWDHSCAALLQLLQQERVLEREFA